MQRRELLHERQPDAGARVLARLAAVGLAKAVEDVRELVLANADAGVADREAERAVAQRRGDLHAPLRRELERVRQQIPQQALELLVVDVQRSAVDRRAERDVEPHAAMVGDRFELCRELGDAPVHVGREHRAEPHAPRLELREVEDLIHEREEPLLVAVHHAERLARLLGERAVAAGEELLERPDGERDRRAELVRDVREELRLQPVELLERADAHVAHRRGDVSRDRDERVDVPLVERRVERLRFRQAPGDEERDRAAVDHDGDRDEVRDA